MQLSLSARAVKSSIRVSHPATEVLRRRFSRLDESSLVPLISILYIAWTSISQACGFDHIVPLYIFFVGSFFPVVLSIETLDKIS